MRTTVFGRIALAVVLIAAGACGGGGGEGGGYTGSAEVSIDAAPRDIDTGDRTEITIAIRALDRNGVVLKVRHGAGLRYVAGSSLLEAQDIAAELPPASSACDQGECYISYLLYPAQFGEDGEGVLRLLLEGAAEALEARIEVDADVIASAGAEIAVNAPQFTAADSVSVSVRG